MRRAVSLLFVLLAALPVGAQQVGTAMPQAPTAAIDAEPPPDAPMAVRPTDDAQPPPPPPVAAPTPPPPGSTTVEVDAEARPPENDTRRFIFRDVTDRTAPRAKSLPEREAAVEALRQSLGGARR